MKRHDEDQDTEVLQVLREVQKRAVVNVKERVLHGLTDDLFNYINQRRLMGDATWWIASEALIVRDLQTLLGR